MLWAFLISFTLFYYKLATVAVDKRIQELWKTYNFIVAIIPVAIYCLFGKISEAQKQFVSVILIVLIATFLVIIFTKHAIISNPYPSLICMDIGTAYVTVSIVISAFRHGLLKIK